MELKVLLRRFAHLKRVLRPWYYRFLGLPPVTTGEISRELLAECITANDPTILEIGANDGAHTIWFKQLLPNATIHCFEPDARARKRFRDRTHGIDNVYLHEIAIGDRTGSAMFHPSDSRSDGDKSLDWHASGSLRTPTGHLQLHPDIQFQDPIAVPCMRLDDWCERNGVGTIDLLWMDVQGAEMDVFSGASESLKRIKYLYTEYAIAELYAGQPSLMSMLRVLKGFVPVVRYNNDILLRNSQITDRSPLEITHASTN